MARDTTETTRKSIDRPTEGSSWSQSWDELAELYDKEALIYTDIDDTDNPYTPSAPEVIRADPSDGPITIELASSDVSNLESRVRVVDSGENSGTNAITIQTEGSENINPGTNSSITISTDGAYVDIWSDGSNWFTDRVAEKQSITTESSESDFLSAGPFLRVEQIEDTLDYDFAPQMVYVGGELLIIFSEQESHGTSPGTIQLFRLENDGWSSRSEVVDDQEDDRQPSPVVDVDSGRIALLYRSIDSGGNQELHKVESTDAGETWSSPENLTSLLTHSEVTAPFGGYVASDRGLHTYVLTEGTGGDRHIEQLLSTDGGQSFSHDGIVISTGDIGEDPGSATPFSIGDGQRIGIGVRDSRSGGSSTGNHLIVQSSDAGENWDTSSTTDINPVGNGRASYMHIKRTHEGTITAAQGVRSPTNETGVSGAYEISYVQIPSESFWQDPTLIERQTPKIIANAYSDVDQDFGYPTFPSFDQLQSNPATIPMTWLDDKNQDGDTDIFAGAVNGHELDVTADVTLSGSDQSVESETEATVGFDTVNRGDDSLLNANAYKLVRPGRYHISVSVHWRDLDGGTTPTNNMRVELDGSETNLRSWVGGHDEKITMVVSGDVDVPQDSDVSAVVLQETGSSKDIIGGDITKMTISNYRPMAVEEI